MTRLALRRATSTSVFVPLWMLWTTAPVEVQAQTQTEDPNVPAKSATTPIPEFALQAGIQILVSEPLLSVKRNAAFPFFSSPVPRDSRSVDLRGRIPYLEFASKYKL